MAEDITLGELGRRLEAHTNEVRESIKEIKDDVHTIDQKVDRMAEFQAVQASHAARLDGHDREIRDLKAENASKSTRTAVWIGSIAAVVALLISAIGYHIIK